MDASKYDLAIAVPNEAADLLEDVLDRSTGEIGSNERDDAKAASEQTTILHLDVGPMSPTESGNTGGGIGHPESSEQIGQLPLVGHHLGDVGKAGDLVWGPRGVTAHDDNVGGRIVSGQASHGLAALGISFGRHGAGVDDTEIGRFVFGCVFVADPQESFPDLA